jgi:hypothetical protein
MPAADLSNWRFLVGGNLPQLAGTAHYPAPQIVEIGTPIELLLHLAVDGEHDSSFQSQIRERLKHDPAAQRWHRQRTKLGSTKHFKIYRKNSHYERYHAAAVAVAAGNATSEQQDWVRRLDDEIGASKVIIPEGQVLFHGRGDMKLHTSSPYPSFVSTSLDPVVCIYHAIKRKLQKGADAKAVIYALTLREPLAAMWGNGGSLKEWELLLRTRLSCAAAATYPGRRFDVIEATIG